MPDGVNLVYITRYGLRSDSPTMLNIETGDVSEMFGGQLWIRLCGYYSQRKSSDSINHGFLYNAQPWLIGQGCEHQTGGETLL